MGIEQSDSLEDKTRRHFEKGRALKRKRTTKKSEGEKRVAQNNFTKRIMNEMGEANNRPLGFLILSVKFF